MDLCQFGCAPDKARQGHGQGGLGPGWWQRHAFDRGVAVFAVGVAVNLCTCYAIETDVSVYALTLENLMIR